MESPQQTQLNKKLGWRFALSAMAMFGFAFALVPLYGVFCAITGLNGKTGGAIDAVAAISMPVDVNRLVTVEFLSSVKSGLPWNFRPVTRKMQVHPGKIYETYYIARNKSSRDVVGQAVPSVAPGIAARYFKKIECFCFTQQTLAAGEQRQMPLRFVLDPGLPASVSVVTLSYTFFESPSNKWNRTTQGFNQAADSRGRLAGDKRVQL